MGIFAAQWDRCLWCGSQWQNEQVLEWYKYCLDLFNREALYAVFCQPYLNPALFMWDRTYHIIYMSKCPYHWWRFMINIITAYQYNNYLIAYAELTYYFKVFWVLLLFLIPFRGLRLVTFSKCFERSILCSPKKYIAKTVITWEFITIWNNCFLFKYILKCNLFLWSKAVFSASLLQSSVSHDPSEIILICWFAA